jgi:hypothetical protein
VSETDPNDLVSAITITDPTDASTDQGIAYIKITRQAAGQKTWKVQWYNDDSRDINEVVQQTTASGTTGTEAIDMTAGDGMRLQFTLHRANCNTEMASAGDTDSSVSIDVDAPRLGDKWYADITNDEAGKFATKIGKCWRVALPSSAAPDVTDTLASAIAMS